LIIFKETIKYITFVKNFNPKVAIIAGSGINNLEKKLKILKKIQYSKIPHFFKVTVQGHKGELILLFNT
jgi:purine nucleoside phosphorylase